MTCNGWIWHSSSRVEIDECFLVPLVWFEFHIGPRGSVGNVAAVSVTCCCFPGYSCWAHAQPLNWRTSCTYEFIDTPNI